MSATCCGLFFISGNFSFSSVFGYGNVYVGEASSLAQEARLNCFYIYIYI